MDTRKSDYEEIEKGLNSKDPNDRRQAKIASERIRAESRDTSRMRQELVEAHRAGNKGKIEELHHRLRIEGSRIKEQVERHYGNNGR